MQKGQFAIIALLGLLAHGPVSASLEEEAAPEAGLRVSPELRAMLQSEMREIAAGAQAITVALASAEWKTVEETAARIRDSYLLHQKWPEAQKQELHRALPESFRQLDRAFHERAGKLAAAAAARDGDLTTFHFERLIESCVACHSRHARSRFPGFSAEEGLDHRH